ncbi:single-stranded DNA-binding protein [Mariniluteicoccus endophyticus]
MEPLITMTGHVGLNPELRETHAKVPFTRLRIAHTPRILRDGEWVDGETTWVSVLCWRHLAENVCRSIRRGDPVFVAGRARVETWVEEKTGVVRESLTIDARAVGHDLTLGSTHFTRIRPDEPEGVVEESAEGADTDTDADGPVLEEGAVSEGGAGDADSTPADERVLVPF